MKKLSIREARKALAHLEETLPRDGEVTITRNGRPIARIRRTPGSLAVPSHKDLRDSIKPMRLPSEILIRRDRDGR